LRLREQVRSATPSISVCVHKQLTVDEETVHIGEVEKNVAIRSIFSWLSDMSLNTGYVNRAASRCPGMDVTLETTCGWLLGNGCGLTLLSHADDADPSRYSVKQ